MRKSLIFTTVFMCALMLSGCTDKGKQTAPDVDIKVVKDFESDPNVKKIDGNGYDGYTGDITSIETAGDDSHEGDSEPSGDENFSDFDFEIENILSKDDGARIVCWGDSLTEGTGGDGVNFPDVLAQKTGRTVLNYGVYAERASLIAARQGGNPQHVEELNEIPASVTPVKVNVVGDNGNWEMWCNNGDAGVNPCRIAGVLGNLTIDENDGSRYFTRLTAGDVVMVPSGEKFYTHAMMDMRADDIYVIWAGSSDGLFEDRSIDDVVRYIKSMIKYGKCSRYVIINYTAKYNIGGAIDEWNNRLAAEFGDNCLDIRSYLINEGLSDAGITPSAEDLKCINDGEIPASLRTDGSHGTGDFYRIVGEQVYNKLVELGYI